MPLSPVRLPVLGPLDSFSVLAVVPISDPVAVLISGPVAVLTVGSVAVLNAGPVAGPVAGPAAGQVAGTAVVLTWGWLAEAAFVVDHLHSLPGP